MAQADFLFPVQPKSVLIACVNQNKQLTIKRLDKHFTQNLCFKYVLIGCMLSIWANLQAQDNSSGLEEMFQQARQMQKELDPSLVRASLGEIEKDQGAWIEEKEPRYGGKLLSFDAFMTEKGVELSWATEDELYSQFFAVERKQADGSFASVTQMKAAGIASGLRSYHALDAFPKEGMNVYRLRQENTNGVRHISEEVSLDYNPTYLLVIQPHPDEQVLSITTPMKIITISIADETGTIVASSSSSDILPNTIDIRALKPGRYLVRVDDGHLVKEAPFIKKK